MAKAQRFNNKLVRCGDAATIACTCGGLNCKGSVCDISHGCDLNVFFEGISDCDDGSPDCIGVECEATFNGNTFLCTWDGAFGGVGYWTFDDGNILVIVNCTAGDMWVWAMDDNTIDNNNCFYQYNIAAAILPQTLDSTLDEADCVVNEACGYEGTATVSIA